MNRRRLLLFAGSTASLGGLASGTGAFSSAEITRKSNINVVDDSNGLVGLVANTEVAGVKEMSGELSITLGVDGEPGVNVNSVYQFGKFVSDDGVKNITENTFPVVTSDDPADMSMGQDSLESAFAVVNQSSQDLNVTLSFELNEVIDGDIKYAFELQSSKAVGGNREGKTKSPGSGDLEGRLDVGESFGVSFIVNALEGLTDDAISGSLTISATPT